MCSLTRTGLGRKKPTPGVCFRCRSPLGSSLGSGGIEVQKCVTTVSDVASVKLSWPIVTNSEFNLTVFVTVSVSGSKVIQVYASLPATSDLTHVAFQLKGFTEIRDLGPGCRHQAGQVQRKIQDFV